MNQLAKVTDLMVDAKMDWWEARREFMCSLVESALMKTGGNQFAAARLLGIHRNTYDRILRLAGHPPTRQRRKAKIAYLRRGAAA